MNRSIQVIVTGGATLCREALAVALRANSDFGVSIISSPRSIRSPLPAGTVVVQLWDPRVDGTDSVQSECTPAGGSHCLFLCASLLRDEALLLLRKEIGGIFLTANSLSDLPDAIRAIAGGGRWLDAQHMRLLVEALTGTRNDIGYSARERSVLKLVLDGLTNKEIGRELALSESSVKATLQRLFRKTGTRTRSQLVRAALEKRERLS